MVPALIKTFESVCAWRSPESFGHENDGYVTFDKDPKTHKTEAFLWKADMSHDHLQMMWLGGQTFVKRALVALVILSPFSTKADTARDEFIREVTVTLIVNQASWLNVTNHVKQAVDGWNEYQRLVKEKE